MSKITSGPMKGMRGKVDALDLVYRTMRDGTTVAQKLPEKPEVPLRTPLIMENRMQMASIGNCYEPFRGQLNYTYEETRVGQTMRRDFIGFNVKQKLGCYLTKEQREAGYQVLGNFQVSCGPDTIPTIQVVEHEGKFVTNIGLGDLVINENTTQAQLAAAIAQNNGDEFCVTTPESLVANGGFGTAKPVYDSITLLFARQLISIQGQKPTIYVESFQIPLLALGEAKERKLSELFDVSRLSVTDVVNGDLTRHCLTVSKGGGIVLFTVIHSRCKGTGTTLCSNQWLVGTNPIRANYLTPEARAEAFFSYGGVNRLDRVNPHNNPPARSQKPPVPDISALSGQGGNQGNTDPTPQTAEIKALANHDGANSRVTGGGVYEVGTTVTLTATSNSQWQFIRWEKQGGPTFTTPTIEVTVPAGGATYTAYFENAE